MHLKLSEFKRPIIYIATSSWFGGKTSNMCAFATREAAVEWAMFSALGFIDWATWQAPQGQYPYETARDDVTLDPTFRAEWTVQGGGSVEVTKTEVNWEFDWAAKEAMARLNEQLAKAPLVRALTEESQ
jgi:hypothetical protein